MSSSGPPHGRGVPPRSSSLPPAAIPPHSMPSGYPPQPPPANSLGTVPLHPPVGYHPSYSIPPPSSLTTNSLYHPSTYAHPSSAGLLPTQSYPPMPAVSQLIPPITQPSKSSNVTIPPVETSQRGNTSRPNYEAENYELITPQQMAQIQNQIRRYKALAKKYNDLKASIQSGAPLTQLTAPITDNSQPIWQPHQLIAGLGSTAAQEGMIGVNVCDIGPQSRYSSKIAPISLPQMLQLREKCFKSSANSTDIAILKLLVLQRSCRSNIIGQNFSLLKGSLLQFPLPIPLKIAPTATGPPPTDIRLLPPDQFYRSKKNNKRDLKLLDKDLKKKNKSEKDEMRR